MVGPVWVVDLGFDNDYRTYPIAGKNDYIYRSGGSVASDAVKRLADRILIADAKSRERLK